MRNQIIFCYVQRVFWFFFNDEHIKIQPTTRAARFRRGQGFLPHPQSYRKSNFSWLPVLFPRPPSLRPGPLGGRPQSTGPQSWHWGKGSWTAVWQAAIQQVEPFLVVIKRESFAYLYSVCQILHCWFIWGGPLLTWKSRQDLHVAHHVCTFYANPCPPLWVGWKAQYTCSVLGPENPVGTPCQSGTVVGRLYHLILAVWS